MESLKEMLLRQQKEEEERKKQEAQHPQMTRDEIVARFNKNIGIFINNVQNDWLKDLIDAGLCSCEVINMMLQEENIGLYRTIGLKVTMGRNVLEFHPIGTQLIGTIGRIDMIANGTHMHDVMFIIAPERATGPRNRVTSWVEGDPKPEPKPEPDLGELVWKYVNRSGRMQYVSLNRDVFQGIILKAIR